MPGETQQTHPRFSPLARPALALAAIVVALLVGEVAVRLSGRAPEVKPIRVSGDDSAYRRSENPLLSFELRPGYRNEAPDLFQTYERINAHGQRDVERALAKPPGVRRILLLGDSVVEGTGIPEQATISRRLEASYREGTVEVLNFGVSGYCTRAEVELLETKGLGFAPDDVVLLFVENDFENFNAEAFRLATQVERPAWAKALFARSAAYRLVALQLDWYGFGSEQDPLGRSLRAIGDNNVVEGLERLRALADREGFRTLIAVWPRFENDGLVDLPAMPGEPGTLVVERLAARVGLPVVRLSGHFRSLVDAAGDGLNPRQIFTIGDRMHPSARGAAEAAEALRAVLDAPAFLERRPEAGFGPGRDDPAAVEAARMLSARGRPDYARVYTRMGNLEQQAGRLDAAEALYREALEEDADLVDAHVNLAHTLSRSSRREEALEHYRAALAADPDVAGARVAAGGLLEALGRPEEARALYLEEAQRNPEGGGEALRRLGNLAFKQGRIEEAATHYEASLTVAPAVAETLNNLGLARERLGDLAGAAARYREALAADPGLVDTHVNLGVVLVRQGNSSAALEAFGAALRLAPGRLDARGNLAAALEGLGRTAAARTEYREGLRRARERGDEEAARRFTAALQRLGPRGGD